MTESNSTDTERAALLCQHPLLSTFQWFPDLFRIKIKVLSMAYKAVNSVAHSYVSDLLPHSFTTPPWSPFTSSSISRMLCLGHFVLDTPSAWNAYHPAPPPTSSTLMELILYFHLCAHITSSKLPSLTTLFKITSSCSLWRHMY